MGFVFPGKGVGKMCLRGVTEFLFWIWGYEVTKRGDFVSRLGMTRRNSSGREPGAFGRVHWIYEIYGGTNGRYVDSVEGRWDVS